MRKTKLIFVEGLPGSGKSMISQFIGINIQLNSDDTEWFNEGDIGHPIDLGEIPDNSIFNPHEYMEFRLKKWKIFTDKLKGSDKVVVLESSMFQHPVNSLLFSNVSKNIIIEHVKSVLDIVACLNPILIYLFQLDVRKSVNNACQCKGENWVNKATQTIEESLYGQSRKIQGLEGMVEYFSARSEVENELCKLRSIQQLLIETSVGNWDKYKKQIVTYLQLERLQDMKQSKSDLLSFAGTYHNDDMNCTFEFAVEKGMLLDKISGLNMIFKEEGVFCLPGLPTELVFQKNEHGIVDKMITGGRENLYIFRNGIEFRKINT